MRLLSFLPLPDPQLACCPRGMICLVLPHSTSIYICGQPTVAVLQWTYAVATASHRCLWSCAVGQTQNISSQKGAKASLCTPVGVGQRVAHLAPSHWEVLLTAHSLNMTCSEDHIWSIHSIKYMYFFCMFFYFMFDRTIPSCLLLCTYTYSCNVCFCILSYN